MLALEQDMNTSTNCTDLHRSQDSHILDVEDKTELLQWHCAFWDSFALQHLSLRGPMVEFLLCQNSKKSNFLPFFKEDYVSVSGLFSPQAHHQRHTQRKAIKSIFSKLSLWAWTRVRLSFLVCDCGCDPWTVADALLLGGQEYIV